MVLLHDVAVAGKKDFADFLKIRVRVYCIMKISLQRVNNVSSIQT